MELKPNFPFQHLLGWQMGESSGGKASLVLDLDDKHLSPIGFAHGAVAYALVDTAMGAAIVSQLEPGEFTSTIEISMRYLKGVSRGRLSAFAEVISRTGRIVHVEGRAELDGEPVALASGSFLVSKLRMESTTG